MTSLALISSAGGQGKTTVAVTIAAAWADRGPTVLIDTDKTKVAGTAVWWLDRAADTPPELTWTKAGAAELAAVLDRIEAPTVVDTFPGMLDENGQLRTATLAVAQAVDAVLVTGSATELAEISEAGKTIREMVSTPVAVVLAKTHPATDASAWGIAARQALDSNDLPVLGSLRRYADQEQAKLARRLPTSIRRSGVVADIDQLMAGLDRWLQAERV